MTLWTSVPRQRANAKSLCWPIIISPVCKCKLLQTELTKSHCCVDGDGGCILCSLQAYYSTLIPTDTYLKQNSCTGKANQLIALSCWSWDVHWGLNCTLLQGSNVDRCQPVTFSFYSFSRRVVSHILGVTTEPLASDLHESEISRVAECSDPSKIPVRKSNF